MIQSPTMKRWQFWLGLVVSALFLWFALRGLGLEDIGAALAEANLVWLIPGIAVYFVGVWARAWRWHYLLGPVKSIPTRTMFPVVAIGYMGNNIYPARAGEVLRAVILRRREAVPVSASLATIIVERVFDGLVMLLFVFVALPFAPLPSDAIRMVVIAGSVVFLSVLFLFFAVAAVPRRFLGLAGWLSGHLLPERFRAPLMGFAERFVVGLAALRSGRGLAMIFLTSVIIWLLETVKYWFVMNAFDFTVSFFALMLMNGVVNLATTLPSAPGYVGTFDAPGIAVLTLYGVDPAIATAYTLTLHAALWLPITLLGIYYMVRIQLNWADIGRAMISGPQAGNPKPDADLQAVTEPPAMNEGKVRL